MNILMTNFKRSMRGVLFLSLKRRVTSPVDHIFISVFRPVRGHFLCSFLVKSALVLRFQF
jgi:hypothetical protein